MPIDEVYKIVTAILVALGGGGAIVFALSSWLGKVWADRLMLTQTAKHQNDLAALQSALRLKVDADLAKIKTDLDILKEKYLKGHNEKIEFYRLTVDIIIEILGDLDYLQTHGKLQNASEKVDAMNRGRLRAYGYLAMLASQEVMTGFDNLFDYILEVTNGERNYEWPMVRQLSLTVLNEVRKDIGIDPAPISYFGKR
jgi:hypothetical protein